ncbi:MAG: molybdopterin converting factor subunit 1 [Reyranellaceae bacterium]
MKIRLLYFAWLRQEIGSSGETLDLPAEIATVDRLMAHLRGRGGGYAHAFAADAVLRAAVNKQVVDTVHPLTEGDEVAFFPPFTGG